jgi:hypothetical protein
LIPLSLDVTVFRGVTPAGFAICNIQRIAFTTEDFLRLHSCQTWMIVAIGAWSPDSTRLFRVVTGGMED